MAKILLATILGMATHQVHDEQPGVCFAKNESAAAGGGASLEVDDTEGWVTVQDHRPMWLPDEMTQHCICDAKVRSEAQLGKRPHIAGCPSMIRGYMLGTKEMNPSEKNVKNDKPIEEQYWIAVVFQLTAPTKAKSAEKEVREFPAGTQILVGGYDMASLYGRADHPSLAFEVCVWPTKKLDVGGGHKMWLYAKKVNPKALERAKSDLVFYEGRQAEALSDPFNGARQLPGGNGPGNGAGALPAHTHDVSNA